VQDQQLQIADREPPGLDEQLLSVVEILQHLWVGDAVPNFGHCLGRIAEAFVAGEGLECRKVLWNRCDRNLGVGQQRTEPLVRAASRGVVGMRASS
jgi:hypothetical protein